jgi:hypothetical protein
MSNQLLTDLGMKGASPKLSKHCFKDKNEENPKEIQYFENKIFLQNSYYNDFVNPYL